MPGVSWWSEFKFMVVDGWRSRGEGRSLGPEHSQAIRDASHTVGGRGNANFSSSSKALEIANEANDRYLASFKDAE